MVLNWQSSTTGFCDRSRAQSFVVPCGSPCSLPSTPNRSNGHISCLSEFQMQMWPQSYLRGQKEPQDGQESNEMQINAEHPEGQMAPWSEGNWWQAIGRWHCKKETGNHFLLQGRAMAFFWGGGGTLNVWNDSGT